MVTLLNPNSNKSNTAYAEPESSQTALPDYSETGPVEPAKKLAAFSPPLTRVEPSVTTSKKTFLARVASPITGLRGLLAGPPMTERDRSRQTLAESSVKNTAALNWFMRTPN